MNTALRILPTLTFLSFSSSCVVVQTQAGEDEPFDSEALAFLEVGRTTKDELTDRLPQPMKFQGGRTWLYAQSRAEDKWEFVGLVVVPPEADIVQIPFGGTDYRYLVVEFDENDVVSSYQTSKSENFIGCNRSGVCSLAFTYMLVAPAERDQAVKRFEATGSRCAVYIYGDPRTLVHVRLGGHQVGGLLDRKGFIFQQLGDGAQKMSVTGPNVRGYSSTSFDCKRGNLLFFEIRTKRPGGIVGPYEIEVLKRKEADARHALSRRRLLLSIESQA